MNPDNNPHNPPSPIDSDATVYKEVLQKIADLLRSTDFTTYLGGITFVMELLNLTYEPDSNVRTVERSSDVVTALSYLVLLSLEHMDEPNDMAKLMGERVEQEVRDYPDSAAPNVFPQDEFSEMLASNPHYGMSLDEFFEIMDLPSEEMFSLMNDMIKLNNVDNVESLFMEE